MEMYMFTVLRTDNREKLNKFNEWLHSIFDTRDSPKLPQLFLILNEMVKNIIDHSNSDGFIHVKIENSFIRFVVNDIGFSIFNNFNLNKNYDDNPINYGLGIKCIIENAKAIDASLIVTDCNESRILNESKNIISQTFKPRQGIEYCLSILL